MKKHKFFAVLTAAVVAISSALVFPSAAFAEEQVKTKTYTLTENVQWMVGERQVGNGLGDDGDGRNICPLIDEMPTGSDDEMPWQLEDITTLGDFFDRYDSLEVKFQALDIQGSLEVLARIEVKNGDPINFTAQDVTTDKNVYTVSFDNATTYTETDELKSVAVYIRSKESSLAKFVLAEYDSNILTATGTQTLTKDFKPESDITVTVNKEQGPPPPDVVTIWGNGPNDEYSTPFPASDIIDLYTNYKDGEITFYVKDLDAKGSIVYDVILNPFGTASSNNTLRSGKNTVKFNLPKISYTNTDLGDIILRFHADSGNTAEFKLVASDTTEPTDSDLFVKENEVSTEIEVPTEAADIPESDRITSITINPAFNMKNKNDNDVELDLSKIKIKAEEIYDKEGLKRAEEALGETIKGNKHYNLLDLTLLYNGEDFSNGYEGLVKVIIPLPNGHRDKNFSCFRLTEVDGKTVKEVIPGEQTEDSYIIYLEHFSLYALVADANPDDGEKQPEESKAPEESAPVTPGDTDKNSGGNSGNNSGNDQANTGIALAIAPIALAVSAVIVASKKKK